MNVDMDKVKSLVLWGVALQREQINKVSLKEHLTTIAFAVEGMIQSLETFYLGDLEGYFKYNLSYADIVKISFLEEHEECTSILKDKILTIRELLQKSDSIIRDNYNGGLEEHIENKDLLEKIIPEAISSYRNTYQEVINSIT